MGADPAVETPVEHGGGIGAVEQRHAQPGPAKRLREGKPDHAGAQDEQVDGRGRGFGTA